MKHTTRVAGLSTIAFGLAGLAWFVLELTPQRLGFQDTDNPEVMLAFIRAYPDVFIYAGMTLILMAIAMTVGTLAIAELAAARSNRLAVRCLSAFGLFSAAFLFICGGIRIQASGPLLHMGSLKDEWGEAAYLAAHVASQATLILSLFTLSVWIVGLSLIGRRTKLVPVGLLVLALLPAFRIVAGFLGPLGILPEGLWIFWILSIPGVILWCLLFGIVLMRRSVGPSADPAPATA